MDIVIRPIEERDYNQIVELFREFALFENLPERMTNTMEQMLKEKAYFNGFAAINPEGMIVGYATWFFAYYTWVGKSMYMDDLYVKPEYRSNGLGTRLITRVIEFARESECCKMRWQVSAWNKPAIEFYKKLGALIEDTEQNCDLMLTGR
ncbi:MAG: family N-acetyltransferase [Bacteroidetes bacterium]|jgi:GNAT superfamily N-acetyltransferase|nr:family N-acetyltransferase [Bacteroidota bacterium]